MFPFAHVPAQWGAAQRDILHRVLLHHAGELASPLQATRKAPCEQRVFPYADLTVKSLKESDNGHNKRRLCNNSRDSRLENFMLAVFYPYTHGKTAQFPALPLLAAVL